MSFESVIYLHYFCQFRSHSFGSDRSLHNLFTHSTSYYSEFTSVFVTDSKYHECHCIYHRLTVSLVYLSQTHSIMSVFLPDSQYRECICHRITVVHVRLFRLPVGGRPANVVSDAGQELLDRFASSDAILAEREEASLQTNVLASDSLPRWLTNQVLSDQSHDFPVFHLDGLDQHPD